MIRSLAVAAAVLTLCTVPTSTAAAVDHGDGTRGAFTLAIVGDEPYGTVQGDHAQLDATPAFIDSINADPDASTVIHLGDIHSGKQYCTQPYDQSIFDLWTRFTDPLVYTPGDNEWTDCHKAAEGGGRYNSTTGQIDYVLDPATSQPAGYAGGNPIANLALVRSMFFARPGQTLGNGSLSVLSQAQVADPAHPSDAQYVENVLWEKRGIVFVTINVPGAPTMMPIHGTERRPPQPISRMRPPSARQPTFDGWIARSPSPRPPTPPGSWSSPRPTCGIWTARHRHT